MRRVLTTAVLSMAALSTAHAASLELGLSDKEANAEFVAPAPGLGLQGAEVGLGLIYNEDDDLVGSVKLQSRQRVSPSFTYQVGVKGYLGRLEEPDETLSAVGIGAGADFSLATQVPITLGLNAWYAPDILSFGDPEGLMQWNARVEAGISKAAAVFLGYNFFEVERDGGPDHKVQDSWVIGVRLGL